MISISRALLLGGVLCAATPLPSHAAAVPCTGLHPMIVILCPDGSSAGYECDEATGRWVMGSCLLPVVTRGGLISR